MKTGAPSQPGFNLDQTFFGFSPEDQVILHDNLFNMIWHGEGRWDWDTIYTMPIFIRRRWMKHVTRILEERAEYQNEIAQAKKNKNRKTKQIASPPIQPKI